MSEQATGSVAETAVPQRSLLQRLLRNSWFWWVVVMLLIFGTQAFVLRMYGVPSGSMEATLEAGDRILVQQVGQDHDRPERTDVVVFTGNPDWGANDPDQLGTVENAVRWFSQNSGLGPGYGGTMVKRAIGLPGETVECCDDDGRVMINGEPIDEPYIYQDFPFEPGELDCETGQPSLRCFGEVQLGEEEYFMLGDHRSNSMDSSAGCRGASAVCDATVVLQEDIVGKVWSRIWPLSRVGFVE